MEAAEEEGVAVGHGTHLQAMDLKTQVLTRKLPIVCYCLMAFCSLSLRGFFNVDMGYWNSERENEVTSNAS